MDKKWTISAIKQYINTYGYTKEILSFLKHDNRKGALALLEIYETHLLKRKREKEVFQEKLSYENDCYGRGDYRVAGIDEAGRGPLAGPVVAAAVILPIDFYLADLDDSKKISIEKRDAFFEVIIKEAVSYGIGTIDNIEIDQLNILKATKKAMYQAVNKLNTAPDHILIDAVELTDLPCESTSIIKGDQKSISIAAASIIAKVTRDRWMKKAAEEYPQYGFELNMGYGTKKHLEALEQYGPSPYHRKSFAPVREFAKK